MRYADDLLSLASRRATFLAITPRVYARPYWAGLS